MSKSKLLHSFLAFVFLVSFASSSSFSSNAAHRCPAEQSLALLHFKQNLSSINDTSLDWLCQDWLGSDYFPVMMNWNMRTDCCTWDGVTCNFFSGDVIELDLSCGMLRGTMHPNTTLFDLPHLRRINLAYNDFSNSQLPSEIGRLSKSLTHLNMSECGLSGQVPTDIALLHNKLVSLDLSTNFDFRFEPHVLNNFTKLEELVLTNVNFPSAQLPDTLNMSSSLRVLYLGALDLQGNLPHYIFNLPLLETLDLSYTSLTGDIPWEVSLLPKLVNLRLAVSNRDYNLRIQPHVFSNLLRNATLLRRLSLANVNISFTLPTYLKLPSSLISLDLESTMLRGKFPENIFSHQTIEELYLSGNSNITGSLPKVKSNTTTTLKILSLAFLNLSTEIPDSIFHIKSLIHLDLSYSNLIGSLPKSLLNLRHLTYLDLSHNKLNGTLPSWLFSLPSLENLILGSNQLEHCPSFQAFAHLTNLEQLDISYNNFQCDWELDTVLSSFTNLTYLDLSYSGSSVTTKNVNHYVNPIFRYLSLASCKLKVLPESIRAMRNLEWLDVSSNEIHGQIPHWAGDIGSKPIAYINFSHNSITGLPQSQWHGLQQLYIQSNQIGGLFPPSICNLKDLWYLDMSNNSFEGAIPQCLGNMSSFIASIDMGNNRFQGTIPNVYVDFRRLTGLILNGNQLEGEIPTSLSNCRSLRVLDLGNNLLNGTFPTWLEGLPDLQALVLKSNNLHGSIVPSSAFEFPFPSLRVLDLSHNGFVGKLPAKYFQNFRAMKNVIRNSTEPKYVYIGSKHYAITVVVKGDMREFPKLLVEYTIIDLSNNSFGMEIPDIIGNLKFLKVLNLSHNSLNGPIPVSLGRLSEIESLDLSWNQLSGEIPQSLADLTFLGFLSLSQNNLEGRIPQGKQFNTFDTKAFGGNPKLCGLPLPKKCGEYPLEETEDGEENGLTWRPVVLGYGCGTLFGLVIGYIMLSTRRFRWFNTITDTVEHVILKRRNNRR